MSGYVYGLGQAGRAPARPRRIARLVGSLAAAAGRVVRVVRRIGVHLPGLAGAAAVCYGAWLAWPPAGFLVVGVFLLAVDRRTS